jgi:arsenate reductase (thioredoxin)
MAEGFARKYGSEVMEVGSAGLAPANIVQPLTRKVMEEKGVLIDDHFPKDLSTLPVWTYDVLINMSGVKLPARIPIEIRDWQVKDPIGQPEEIYVRVRDQIETQVMHLILEFRRDARRSAAMLLPRRARR